MEWAVQYQRGQLLPKENLPDRQINRLATMVVWHKSNQFTMSIYSIETKRMTHLDLVLKR